MQKCCFYNKPLIIYFLAPLQKPVWHHCKHDWTASEQLLPENLCNPGCTTFESGAEQQRSI